MGAWNPIKLACLERQDGLLPWVTSREDLQAIQGEEGPDGCCAQALMHHACELPESQAALLYSDCW